MTQEVFAETLAVWIRKNRKRLGMTQLHLAMALTAPKCRITRSTIAAWERGERTVSAFDHARLRACFESREAVHG